MTTGTAACGGRRLGHAQRIQRRLRLERLRGAEGYAYVSQNKGIYNLALSTSSDPLGCRLNPASGVYVHFYDDDPGQVFTRWNQITLEATAIGRSSLEIRYGRGPAPTMQWHLKRRLPGAPRHRDGPDLFDGGVDWEGTIIDPVAANILSTLPPAILNYPDYVASGYSPASTAAKNMRDAAIRPI